MTLPLPPDREFIDFQQAVAGVYSLERELGRGGMGIVFLAREVRLARPVAIKVLPRLLAASRPELRQRFVREAQMAAQLSHPNIVPIHHVDEAGEFVYFVMAYIDGETLGERLRSRGPLPVAEAARLFRDVGWALAYAHLRGIVHRDIKPDNILLERGTGRALVTDFGIAGDVETPSTADGGYIRGTVHYLSPEQAAGAPVDGRSDLYSLGVTAYYALTGTLPFDAANPMGVLVAHASQRPRAITERTPAVPHRLANAVERCLEKRPELRWESGEKFAEAVDAAFEAPRELPAPLRAWMSQSDRRRGVQVIVGLYGGTATAALIANNRLPTAAAVVTIVAVLALLPTLAAVRRLIGDGYGLDDLRSAVATHVSRKREEFEYEARAPLALSPKRMWSLASAAAVVTTVTALVMRTMGPSYAAIAGAVGVMGGSVTVGLTLIGFVRSVQLGRIRWLGSPRLRFWKSRWGERLYRLSGIGLRKPAPVSAIPQHTEVALGRALDALFESLPRETRRELKDVPATVHRLEDEASKLRDAIERLEEAVDAAQRAGQPDHEAAVTRERDAVAEKLALTVTALETIRLGLLRLQIGAAPVTSVTEAIEAATRLGDEMALRADAEREAADALKPKR